MQVFRPLISLNPVLRDLRANLAAMKESEKKNLLARLAAVEAELAELKAVNRYANLSPDTIVGKDYVANKFGCSESAVLRGRCGTAGLKPVRHKPLGYLKSQVDAFHREYTRPARELAVEEVAAAEKRSRRRSIITR